METYVGEITHFFNHQGVAVVALTGELKLHDIIHITGHTTDYCQEVKSLEVNHHQVERVGPDDNAALKVAGTVRCGDRIYLAPDARPTDPAEILEQRLDAWER